jgi:hypothetical protein
MKPTLTTPISLAGRWSAHPVSQSGDCRGTTANAATEHSYVAI